MNAAKTRYGVDDLDALFAGGSKVVAAKGKNVVEIALGDEDAAERVAAIALGPTGNLRAPTVRVGKTWIVGFNEELYGDRL